MDMLVYPVGYAPYLYRIGATGRTRDAISGRYARNGSLSGQLRNLGLMDGKYVPRPYLEAGAAQRLALLQGLMDTDGFVDDIAGRCEFTKHAHRTRYAWSSWQPAWHFARS